MTRSHQFGQGVPDSHQLRATSTNPGEQGPHELFPVLKRMRNRRGGDFSGGQQQQIAIGRAPVIEPTKGIQPTSFTRSPT